MQNKDLEEAVGRVTALEAALREISRRTGLLVHQNTGRWDMRVEHDRRTVGVLQGNQAIAAQALEATSQEVENG